MKCLVNPCGVGEAHEGSGKGRGGAVIADSEQQLTWDFTFRGDSPMQGSRLLAYITQVPALLLGLPPCHRHTETVRGGGTDPPKCQKVPQAPRNVCSPQTRVRAVFSQHCLGSTAIYARKGQVESTACTRRGDLGGSGLITTAGFAQGEGMRLSAFNKLDG